MESALLLASGLLLIGVFLRVVFKPLQVLYIPAAIVGGMLGLIAGPHVLEWIPKDMVANLKPWPGWLISIVFAGLLLDRPPKSIGDSFKGAARAGLMVYIIILGQIALGLLATWLIIQPFYPVPNYFGQLIETGFAGGHGTAAAMGRVFKSLDYEEGADLAYFMATAGLIYSVISGMVYVNLAVRRGWTRAGDVEVPTFTGLEARENPQPVAFGKIRSEVVDPFVFQVLLLGLAFGLGKLMQWGVHSHLLPWIQDLITEGAKTAEGEISNNIVKYGGNIPLFIYTLLGGLIVREVMGFFKADDLIDGESIKRISAFAMEFLIVAAMTALNLHAVIKLFVPLSILLLIGFAWTGICLLVIGRRLLPKNYWFELGVINYGMSTGTTAQGLMLLRIIDKDLDSGAAEDYALAAPLSAPFIGGGIVTLSLPYLLMKFHIAPVAFGCLAAMAVLYVIGRRMAANERKID